MSSVKRASAAAILPRLARGLCLATGFAAIVATAGCSDDVTRFDLLGDLFSSSPTPPSAGYAPTGRGYRTGSHGGGYGLEETSLPPVRRQGADRDGYRVVGRDRPPARRSARRTRRAEARPREPFTWSNGTPRRWVEQPPLWTDSGPPARREREAEPFPWPDDTATPRRDESAPRRAETSPARRPAFQGHYTMQRGDTLGQVARHYKVSLAALKRVNGIADARSVEVGTVLAIPERGAAAPARRPDTAAPRVVQSAPRRAAPKRPRSAPRRAAPSPQQPKRVAAARTPERRTTPRREHNTPERNTPEPSTRERSTTEALPRPTVAGGKFRWPARGRIITRFGAQTNGSKSEGINLAVPMGTDIHAAETGRVHYVGDGLKGYGNLILIRHANGWVSAYAHADRALVRVGDEVRRGQVIGKAGKTGPVAQPQLHFELRKGSVPVDPLPHLTG